MHVIGFCLCSFGDVGTIPRAPTRHRRAFTLAQFLTTSVSFKRPQWDGTAKSAGSRQHGGTAEGESRPPRHETGKPVTQYQGDGKAARYAGYSRSRPICSAQAHTASRKSEEAGTAARPGGTVPRPSRERLPVPMASTADSSARQHRRERRRRERKGYGSQPIRNRSRSIRLSFPLDDEAVGLAR